MKKIVLVALAVLLLLGFVNTVIAAEENYMESSYTEDIGVRYTYIISVSAALDINTSGKAVMSAAMDCYATVDRCSISAYLQRYDNGSWITVESYSKYSNSNSCLWSTYHYVTSGYNYRLLAYFYAWDGETRESTYLTRTDYY